jgi:hypothetical protein
MLAGDKLIYSVGTGKQIVICEQNGAVLHKFDAAVPSSASFFSLIMDGADNLLVCYGGAIVYYTLKGAFLKRLRAAVCEDTLSGPVSIGSDGALWGSSTRVVLPDHSRGSFIWMLPVAGAPAPIEPAAAAVAAAAPRPFYLPGFEPVGRRRPDPP